MFLCFKGKRGCGKSTLMSLLAGSKFQETNVFKSSVREGLESGQHTSSGIQAFVTGERTILLDVQPLLSSSILDKAINLDKKHITSDFKYYENFIEMQSIELACFILSACNVVLVAEDWFMDPNLFRILQTAEMLMPNMAQSVDEPQWEQKHPHVVYVLNKSENLSECDLVKMRYCIADLMRDSKLVYKNSIRNLSASSQLIQNRKRTARTKHSDSEAVNFIVIPKVDKRKEG